MSDVRVRFAPSPTGALHIGGVRTALYNYLFARHNNGKFILRIEDTDQNRFVEGAEDYITRSLSWLGLEPDESPMAGGEFGPYRQSERKGIYKEFADKLIADGLAYYAFDTSEEIDKMRQEQKEAGSSNMQYNFETRDRMQNSLTLSEEETNNRLSSGDPFVVRINMPADEIVVINDEIRGRVEVNTSTLDDKVLLKSDGLPTYHLANVVDDHLMKITHVIRGEEWLPSAALHTILYKFLGWADTMPKFAHMPLILKPEGKGKLSKRDADKGGFPIFPLNWTDPESANISVGYKETGYLPEALNNFLALLGWHPGSDEEIFSLTEMAELFELDKVGKSGIRFDIEKANWYNQEYIKSKSDKELGAWLKSFLSEKGIDCSEDQCKQVASMMKERVTFPSQMYSDALFLYEDPTSYDEKMARKKWDETAVQSLSLFAAKIESLDHITADEARTTMGGVTESLGIGMGKVMPGFRLSLTGVAGGPDLMAIVEFLGPKKVVERINNAIRELQVA